ncbi:hypothetical protein [Neobacillus vireti]|uniref:Uncharacterized protein n=1 Tax=Neobacillus vireti LMG 21834 TaxID=1131730 RepID=A0AB94IJU1_9BACI|nr:hypothetical protein [Neobacillus vireti]ETI67262.1 hypothetical protein BAVI_18472 [Neobacillus vireti LMG 21834]KLT19657.1 hypothetical protein AA980_03440 [Neobacillus vireti]
MKLKETRIFEGVPNIEIRTVIKDGKKFLYHYQNHELVKKVLVKDFRAESQLNEMEAYIKQAKFQQKRYKK